MKNAIKLLASVVVMFMVLGTLALLAIKYFDVLVRIFDNVKDGLNRKRFGVFSDECCDFCEDDIDDDGSLEPDLI